MYCEQCGNQVENDARYCPACGARIENRDAGQQETPSGEPYTLPDTGEAENQDYEQTPPQGQVPHVKNYLVESILCVIFCCRPFAIVGIVFAAQVDKFLRAGHIDMAVDASEKAKKWTLISFIIGLVVNLLVIALYGTALGSILKNIPWY
jgi:hypothetical protein